MKILITLAFFFYLTPIICLLFAGFRILKGVVNVILRKRDLNFSLFYKFNRFLGVIEYYLIVIRNPIFGLIFTGILAKEIYEGVINGYNFDCKLSIAASLFFLLLNAYSKNRHINVSLKMAEFLRSNPHCHPSLFFKTVHKQLGPLELPLPTTIQTVSPASVSFKKHDRSSQSYLVMIPTLVDTGFLAHTSLRALHYLGKEFAREVFDVMSAMWGKRVLEHFSSSLTVSGAERLANLPGKIILVFNHKSQLDFVFTFFCLSHVKRLSGRNFRPRFITAKDQFVDNPFIYSTLGIGRLIESVDMVFIERKKKNESIKNLMQAATFLADKEIEIAIYPQGTRPEGNMDRSGKRRDAGYYTTFSRSSINDDEGHLKKGTAHLTCDALIEIFRKNGGGELHLVFMGIRGTSTIMPKQSFKVQTEVDLEYEVGTPLTLDTSLASQIKKPEGAHPQSAEEERYMQFVAQIQTKIDQHLEACLHVNEHLKHRYLLDLQGTLRYAQDKLDWIERNIDTMAKKTTLPYQILDRIYALNPQQWNSKLDILAQYIMKEEPIDRFKKFREEISLEMLQGVKTKMHGKKVS